MEERGYTVVRCLGGGSQGRVYEARDGSGRLRVIKQLPWVDEHNREDALREVRLLSALRHPCIVPYLENFLARSSPSLPVEDLLCLVMSRCEHDLRRECSRRAAEGSRIEEPHALSWLAQLCWGLQHLHSRKFLHRDLKPQNVLLSQSGRVLLADFGVACHLERTEDFRSTRVGTLAFMSPEMMQGRPYGRKTDQWALGCVLFEVMALEPPFVNCVFPASFTSSVSEALSTRLPPGYSEELHATLKALLARKPDDRPSNAELLRGPLLRGPFSAFVQSLEAAAAAAAFGMDSADGVALPSGFSSRGGGLLNGGVTTSMQDFLHTVLPAEDESPRPMSVTTGSLGLPVLPKPRQSGGFSSAVPEDKSATFGSSLGLALGDSGRPQCSLPPEVDAASCTSDLENYILTDSPVAPRSPASEARQETTPRQAARACAQPEDPLEDEEAELEHEISFALGHADIRATEWRQLLEEAETMLQPQPEAKTTALDELEKARKQLLRILGTEPRMERALTFLRERKPLGEEDDAEELLLQVELVDLVGDEGLDALPLLERCLSLEAAAQASGTPVARSVS